MRRYTLQIRGREFVIDVEEQAADRFEVVVGDERFEVTLAGDEDLPEATITPAFAPTRAGAASASAPPAHTASRSTAPATPAPIGSAHAGGGAVNAPMPGVILEVSVAAGHTVVRGQPLVVLEAMKMKNTIRSPRAGTVAEVCVAVGQAVGHGDAVVRFAKD